MGADNYYLHAKILLSVKELKESVIVVLLEEIDAGKEEVFLDSAFSDVKVDALKFLSKQLELCEEVRFESKVKVEIKSLCNPDDIEKMIGRISEYEAQVRYKSNNEKGFSNVG